MYNLLKKEWNWVYEYNRTLKFLNAATKDFQYFKTPYLSENINSMGSTVGKNIIATIKILPKGDSEKTTVTFR